jgi:hypothetical protein
VLEQEHEEAIDKLLDSWIYGSEGIEIEDDTSSFISAA